MAQQAWKHGRSDQNGQAKLLNLPAFPRSRSASNLQAAMQLDRTSSLVSENNSVKRERTSDISSAAMRPASPARRHRTAYSTATTANHGQNTAAGILDKLSSFTTDNSVSKLYSDTRHSIAVSSFQTRPIASGKITDGFYSPNKSQVMREVTREHMKQLVLKQKSQGIGHLHADQQPKATQIQQPTSRHAYSRNMYDQSEGNHDNDDDLQDQDQKSSRHADIVKPPPDNNDSQVKHKHSSSNSMVAIDEQQTTLKVVEASQSPHIHITATQANADVQLDAVICDVAARIIQAHWRAYKGRQPNNKQQDDTLPPAPCPSSSPALQRTTSRASGSKHASAVNNSTAAVTNGRPKSATVAGHRAPKPYQSCTDSLLGLASGIAERTAKHGAHKIYTVSVPSKSTLLATNKNAREPVDASSFAEPDGEPSFANQEAMGRVAVADVPSTPDATSVDMPHSSSDEDCKPRTQSPQPHARRKLLLDSSLMFSKDAGCTANASSPQDATTLLRKLAAGDVPSAIPEHQLQLLLNAIEAAQATGNQAMHDHAEAQLDIGSPVNTDCTNTGRDSPEQHGMSAHDEVDLTAVTAPSAHPHLQVCTEAEAWESSHPEPMNNTSGDTLDDTRRVTIPSISQVCNQQPVDVSDSSMDSGVKPQASASREVTLERLRSLRRRSSAGISNTALRNQSMPSSPCTAQPDTGNNMPLSVSAHRQVQHNRNTSFGSEQALCQPSLKVADCQQIADGAGTQPPTAAGTEHVNARVLAWQDMPAHTTNNAAPSAVSPLAAIHQSKSAGMTGYVWTSPLKQPLSASELQVEASDDGSPAECTRTALSLQSRTLESKKAIPQVCLEGNERAITTVGGNKLQPMTQVTEAVSDVQQQLQRQGAAKGPSCQADACMTDTADVCSTPAANFITPITTQPKQSSPTSSMTAEKLHSILAFLDDVENKSILEAANVGNAASRVRRSVQAFSERLVTTTDCNSQPVVNSHSNLLTTGGMQQQPLTQEESSVASFGNISVQSHQTASSQASGTMRTSLSFGRQPSTASLPGGIPQVSSTVMHKPANLAENVYDGVKAKLRRLQEDLKERDQTIVTLRKELDCMQQRADSVIAATEARASDAVAAARLEHEAALARHLSFMDRLLADKDDLNRQVMAMSESMKASEERHEKTLAKLKDGFAAELRRQKEAWTASERARRDQWMEQKTSEVKELTVKGLEVEVQKLLAKHKADLAAAQAAGQEEVRRAVDMVAAQHELALRQLRDRMSRELEEALEKERAASQQRLREASERYEQQISMQRMKLVADGDIRLEQAEATRREERRRHEEALARAASEADERVRAAVEEASKERDALRKAHEKQLEGLREAQSAEQEGWRAAVSERARRELEQREAALAEQFARERDQQLQVIVQRLESESQAASEAARQEALARETAATSRHAAAMKEAKKTEARLLEQFNALSEQLEASESRLAAMESSLESARNECDTRASTIRWLESQVSEAQAQAKAAEANQAASSQQALQAIMQRKDALERQLASVQRELQDVKSRHAQEMDHLEARVKAALAVKDEALAAAQQRVSCLAEQLRHTEEVLAAQQAELGAM